MYEHVAESYVCVSNSRRLVDEVSARIADLCQAVTGDDPVRTFMFEEGEAIMRSTEDRLLLWIGASSLLMRHSLQVAIESSLFHVMSRRPAAIPWHPGEGTPFAVVERLLEKPQATSTTLKADRAHISDFDCDPRTDALGACGKRCSIRDFNLCRAPPAIGA